MLLNRLFLSKQACFRSPRIIRNFGRKLKSISLAKRKLDHMIDREMEEVSNNPFICKEISSAQDIFQKVIQSQRLNFQNIIAEMDITLLLYFLTFQIKNQNIFSPQIFAQSLEKLILRLDLVSKNQIYSIEGKNGIQILKNEEKVQFVDFSYDIGQKQFSQIVDFWILANEIEFSKSFQKVVGLKLSELNLSAESIWLNYTHFVNSKTCEKVISLFEKLENSFLLKLTPNFSANEGSNFQKGELDDSLNQNDSYGNIYSGFGNWQIHRLENHQIEVKNGLNNLEIRVATYTGQFNEQEKEFSDILEFLKNERDFEVLVSDNKPILIKTDVKVNFIESNSEEQKENTNEPKSRDCNSNEPQIQKNVQTKSFEELEFNGFFKGSLLQDYFIKEVLSSKMIRIKKDKVYMMGYNDRYLFDHENSLNLNFIKNHIRVTEPTIINAGLADLELLKSIIYYVPLTKLKRIVIKWNLMSLIENFSFIKSATENSCSFCGPVETTIPTDFKEIMEFEENFCTESPIKILVWGLIQEMAFGSDSKLLVYIQEDLLSGFMRELRKKLRELEAEFDGLYSEVEGIKASLGEDGLMGDIGKGPNRMKRIKELNKQNKDLSQVPEVTRKYKNIRAILDQERRDVVDSYLYPEGKTNLIENESYFNILEKMAILNVIFGENVETLLKFLKMPSLREEEDTFFKKKVSEYTAMLSIDNFADGIEVDISNLDIHFSF